jgi:hypothetical protein
MTAVKSTEMASHGLVHSLLRLAALPYGGESTPLLLPIGGAHHDDTRHRALDHQTDYAIAHCVVRWC